MKTSSSQKSAIILLDTGSDGNILPYILMLFPRASKEQLVATKHKTVILKTYKKTTILQLGTYTIIIIHKNKHILYKLFVVPGNGPPSAKLQQNGCANIK